MARPYSRDLRERVVEAVEAGQSRQAAARRFGVSASFAIKLLQRWQETGKFEAKQVGGQKDYALRRHEALVRQLMSSHPDLTIDELNDRLGANGISISRAAVGRFLVALGLTRKKRRSMPPSRTGPTSPQLGRSGERTNRR
jgi:transposase